MALPVPREIDRRLTLHGEPGDALELIAIRHAAVIFAPSPALISKARAFTLSPLSAYAKTPRRYIHGRGVS